VQNSALVLNFRWEVNSPNGQGRGLASSAAGDKTPCIIFAHGNKIITNQWLEFVTCALLTILSTQNVQKCTVVRDS
jgi:hypothetical protein